MKDRILEITLVLIFVTISIVSFGVGLKVGENSKAHEYRLLLENQDAEIILESVDEIVSRQIAESEVKNETNN